MAQIIVFENENGGVSMCIPTGELPIEQVLEKDCPNGAVIIDDANLPSDKTFFDAWVLNNGAITVDETKKAAIEEKITKKLIALQKLTALGLTTDDLSVLGIK